MLAGKAKAALFGNTRPEQIFQAHSEILDRATWVVRGEPSGFWAEAKACKPCAIAREMSAPSPCHICCLDPTEGMIKGLAPDMEFAVTETHWSGSKCQMEIRK